MSSNEFENGPVYYLEERSETDLSHANLPDKDLDALEAHEKISNVSRSDEIKIAQYIGHIGLPSGAHLEVQPKESLERFKPLYYFAKAGRVSEELVTGSQEIGFSAGESFLDVLGEVFADEINRLLGHGLHTRYVPQKQATSYIKGQLQVSDQIQHQEPLATSFESSFDELTADIPLNRLILYTAVELADRVESDSVESRLRRKAHELRQQVSLPSMPPDTRQVTLTRETQAYQPLVRLAERILDETYIHRFGQQTRLLQSVLVNTETLFEQVVFKTIAEVVQSSKYVLGGDGDPENAVDGNIGSLLEDENGEPLLELQPDVFLRARGETVWIADAKWREDDSPKRSNLYQVTGYQRKMEVPGIMFYPEQGGNIEAVYELKAEKDGVWTDELRVVELPLGGEDYESFEAEIESRVRSVLQEQFPAI